MKIKYLGTGAAERVPAMFCKCQVCQAARMNGGKDIRSQSQLVIDDDKLLIDFPGDTYFNALRNGIDLSDIKHLLVTHWHSDHFYGEDVAYRQEPYGRNLSSTMNIYGPARVYDFYARAIKLEGILDPARIQYTIVNPFQEFVVDNYTIWTFRALHGDRNGDCLFYAISDGEKNILYAHDTGKFDDEIYHYIIEKEMRFDLVSLDCTRQIEESEKSHMNFKDVLDVKTKLGEIGAIDSNTILVVNHFSHNGGLNYKEMYNLGKNNGFQVSYDGMEIEI